MEAVIPSGRYPTVKLSGSKMAARLSVTGDVVVYDLSIAHRAETGEMPAVDDGDGQCSEALSSVSTYVGMSE
jgi:hypothetical protein